MSKLRTLMVMAAFLGLLSAPAQALRPISHYHDLVAGQGCPGFRDGDFATALFDHPIGLALSEDGKTLYVADQHNERIRAVHLDQDNRVETVAGNGETGSKDGAADQATFSHPTGLLALPGGQLLVNDLGNHLLRLVDLTNRKVTTIAGTSQKDAPAEGPARSARLAPVWNMVYLPSDKAVYLTQAESGALRRLDLATTQLSAPLVLDPPLSQAKCLCLFQGKLCVSDGIGGGIYRLEPTGNSLPGHSDLKATSVGKGGGVVAMAASGDDLYGLQFSGDPIVQLNPYRAVHLYSPWGFSWDEKDSFANPMLDFDPTPPESPGLVADPEESHKFLMASSNLQSVVDFKDYRFDELNNADNDAGPQGLTDFYYPEKKPPHTIRILVVGNSLPTWSHEFKNNPDLKAKRSLTFPKQWELSLNTQAALNDLPVRFEVLVYRHKITGGFTMFDWPCWETPEAARHFDADLVLFFCSSTSLLQYTGVFDRPSTSEGVLAKTYDPEYLLRPEKERFQDPFVKPFYEKALKAGLIKPATPPAKTVFANVGFVLKEPSTRQELERLMAKPLSVLRERLEAVRKASGKGPAFVICYAPGGLELDCSRELVRRYWEEVGKEAKVPFLDLTAPYEALKFTYSPTYENYTGYHFNVYGANLLAQILTHEFLSTPWAGQWKGSVPAAKGGLDR